MFKGLSQFQFNTQAPGSSLEASSGPYPEKRMSCNPLHTLKNFTSFNHFYFQSSIFKYIISVNHLAFLVVLLSLGLPRNTTCYSEIILHSTSMANFPQLAIYELNNLMCMTLISNHEIRQFNHLKTGVNTSEEWKTFRKLALRDPMENQTA